MSAQTTYRFSPQIGAAGGIVDLAPYAIDSFTNEENDGMMEFGVGVVGGTAASQIKLPASTNAAGDFQGVTVNNRTTELDLVGNLGIRKGATVGVMRYGRIYVRLATGAEPQYGDPLYMVKSASEFGYFTNSSDGTIPVKGRFLGGSDATANIAPVELFNQAQG